MEQHHFPSDGTLTQLRHQLVHFVRENVTLIPEDRQVHSGDDHKEDLEPSMAELNLEESPGEYQIKTTEKGTLRDAPKEEEECPDRQASNIQPAVNHGNHQKYERYEQGR
jgi:hypothetical protein